MINTIQKIRPLISLSKLLNRYSKAPSNIPNKIMPVKTLEGFGYAFNTAGQLRKLDNDGKLTDETFQFNVSSNHQECQAHYEEVGNAVTNHIYYLLETQENLLKLPVPKTDVSKNGTFIFVSKGFEKKDKLMVFIHGSGAVRAGQWARSLIINESIDSGSQIPYIRKAVERDFGVVILNTNDNYLDDGSTIEMSSTAEEHAFYVWNTYVQNTKASSIVIVAHSYGGVVTVAMADHLKGDFEKRVKAIAFTDSVHSYSNTKISDNIKKISRNWISSTSPLDMPMKTPEFDIERVSAGHPKHEMTSCTCINSVFKFIEEKLSKD